MIKIKICGVTNSQDALWAANLGADYIGLNFYAQSPRKVSPKNAKDIVAQLPPFVQSVGIFVNEDLAVITKTIKASAVKTVQLHGQETPEFCDSVKALGVRVIKAISLSGPLNPEELLPFESKVDHFLFDTHSAELPGGTGQTFDWTWLQRVTEITKPWFLAGGLTPDNVAEAIRVTHPPAVDVCSGVERLPTRKDYEAMKRFIQAVRAVK
jgi:phosphoribosylanthranilate isomerase